MRLTAVASRQAVTVAVNASSVRVNLVPETGPDATASGNAPLARPHPVVKSGTRILVAAPGHITPLVTLAGVTELLYYRT